MSALMARIVRKSPAWDPAVTPIVVIVGGAVVGAGYYLTRLATRPDITWDKRNNPYPWQHVSQGQNTKFTSVNQQFEEGKWSRDRL